MNGFRSEPPSDLKPSLVYPPHPSFGFSSTGIRGLGGLYPNPSLYQTRLQASISASSEWSSPPVGIPAHPTMTVKLAAHPLPSSPPWAWKISAGPNPFGSYADQTQRPIQAAHPDPKRSGFQQKNTIHQTTVKYHHIA